MYNIIKKLISDWKEETGFMSNPDDMLKTKSAIKLIELGNMVIPEIIRDMKKEPSHLFSILHKILKAGPFIPTEYRGNIKQINKIWLDFLDFKVFRSKKDVDDLLEQIGD